MKIISWNVNGYRSITGQNPSKRYNVINNDNKLFNYIEKSNPDVVCLQETKANVKQINSNLLYPQAYNGHYFSAERKGYSGVATFAKNDLDARYSSGFGVEKFDNEGRVIITEITTENANFTLINVYFPNGKRDVERLNYKLDFYDSLTNFIEKKRKTQPNILICGDYNTAHHPIDLTNPKQNEKESGFLLIERERLDYLEKLDYIDVFRYFNSEPNQYSWWSNIGNARARNVGWRIDYFWATKDFLDNIKNCYMEQEIMGSDHCPVVIELC